MRPTWRKTLVGSLLLIALGSGVKLPAQSQTIRFSGYDWTVKTGDSLGPGPNAWRSANAWVDSSGALHLKIAQTNGQWTCAEVATTQRLGFGAYQFQIIGRVDQLDKNVVLGLFNYPPASVGPDGTNEIDIEFARWGQATAPIGNYTVWPARTGLPNTSKSFAVTLNGDYSTHRFTWTAKRILFQSLHGHRSDNQNEFQRWLYQPDGPRDHVGQSPMPVILNLWLFQGHAPSDGHEVEIVVHDFKFTPNRPILGR